MNVNILPIILLFFTHWVGDFLCQTRMMADRKGKSIFWLTVHVLVYAAVLTAAAFVVLSPPWAITFVVINFVLHWITDFTTSKYTSYFYQNKNNYGFFSTIGFDQFIHSITLMLTYAYALQW